MKKIEIFYMEDPVTGVFLFQNSYTDELLKSGFNRLNSTYVACQCDPELQGDKLYLQGSDKHRDLLFLRRSVIPRAWDLILEEIERTNETN